ncbi:chemotaxis protein CheX [bacterium]|nr:chemotaxis protein CheX [bacterium]
MIPKFFGQFLLENKYVSQEHLFSALQYQQSEDAIKIGEVAVLLKLMTPEQVQKVHRQQRQTDEYFGELAISMGFLNEEQLQKTINFQRNNHIFLGQALIELDYLTKEQLKTYLDEFENEQKPIASLEYIIPKNIDLYDEIFILMDVSIKIFRRMADLHLKIGKGFYSNKNVDNKYLISLIRLVGNPEIKYFLNLPQKVACSITRNLYKSKEVDCDDETICDSIGELSNIICGNAISHILESGRNISMTPPLSYLTMNREKLSPKSGQKLLLFPASVQIGELDVGILY